MSPLPENAKALTGKPLTEQDKSHFANSFAILLQQFPELGQLVESWPDLSAETREKILKVFKDDNQVKDSSV